MDITDHILKYRETVMNLWNEIYVPAISDRGGNTYLEENFCQIEVNLFEILVLYYLTEKYDSEDIIDSHMKSPCRSLPHFYIVPNDKLMTAHVNRELHSGYWDHPVRQFEKGKAEINLVHFFDWESYDCPRKYQYFRGRIKSFRADPSLNGKDVLIPVSECTIYYRKTD
jgi:hypothetical protein